MKHQVTIDKETMRDLLGMCADIETSIESLPYRDAVGPLRTLKEIRDVLTEELPGGSFDADCCYCELPMGNDEVIGIGDEYACRECVERMEKQSAA